MRLLSDAPRVPRLKKRMNPGITVTVGAFRGASARVRGFADARVRLAVLRRARVEVAEP